MGPKDQVRGESLVRTVTVLFFLPVLVVTCIFFAMKFYDFILVAIYEPEGAFAVTPIVNYIMAGLGFLCLLGWAAANGMFHDIEKPKQTMLENEERLDAWERERDEREAAGRGMKGSL